MWVVGATGLARQQVWHGPQSLKKEVKMEIIMPDSGTLMVKFPAVGDIVTIATSTFLDGTSLVQIDNDVDKTVWSRFFVAEEESREVPNSDEPSERDSWYDSPEDGEVPIPSY
jgi:urease gamma subunit